MLDTLYSAWGGGYEGRYIEDLISGAFADFAPYAAADQERVAVTRMHAAQPCVASSVLLDPNSNAIFHVQHSGVGSVSFSGAPALLLRSHLRVPLPPPLPFSVGPPAAASPVSSRAFILSSGASTSAVEEQRSANADGKNSSASPSAAGIPNGATRGPTAAEVQAECRRRGISGTDALQLLHKRHLAAAADAALQPTPLPRFFAIGRGGVFTSANGLPRISGDRTDYGVVYGGGGNDVSRDSGSFGQVELEGLSVPEWFGPLRLPGAALDGRGGEDDGSSGRRRGGRSNGGSKSLFSTMHPNHAHNNNNNTTMLDRHPDSSGGSDTHDAHASAGNTAAGTDGGGGDSRRLAVGVSAGPVSLRLSRTQQAIGGGGGAAPDVSEGAASSPLPSYNETRRAIMTGGVRDIHTIDAAVCLAVPPPFALLNAAAPLTPSFLRPLLLSPAPPAAAPLSSHDAHTHAGGVRGYEREAPWAVTASLQLPLEGGDTLLALALQTDRATSYGQREGAPMLADGSVLLPAGLLGDVRSNNSNSKSHEGDDAGVKSQTAAAAAATGGGGAAQGGEAALRSNNKSDKSATRQWLDDAIAAAVNKTNSYVESVGSWGGVGDAFVTNAHRTDSTNSINNNIINNNKRSSSISSKRASSPASAADLLTVKGVTDPTHLVSGSLVPVPGSTQLALHTGDDTVEEGSNGDGGGASGAGAKRSAATIPLARPPSRPLGVFPVPDVALRLLIVQTLQRRPLGDEGFGYNNSNSNNNNNSGSLSDSELSPTLMRNSSSSGGGSGSHRHGAGQQRRRSPGGQPQRWWELPTLFGAQLCLWKEALRLSAAVILHDGTRDLEAAAALDLTPLAPQQPTTVRVGFNDTGRLSLGITSLFYKAFSVTLGAHLEPGEPTRFGLEMKL